MSIHSNIDDKAYQHAKRLKESSKSGNSNFYALASYAISHLFPMVFLLIIVSLMIIGAMMGDSSSVVPEPSPDKSYIDPNAYENVGYVFMSMLIACGIGYVFFTITAFVMGVIGVISQPNHRKLGFAVIVLTLPVLIALLYFAYLYFMSL